MYRLLRPLLFRMDPERAHDLTFRALELLGPVARAAARLRAGARSPRLATEVAGLELGGPVGLAAGLDKDGRLVRLWPCLGFGSVELGTVTAHAQPGNPRPRLFRFPEEGALVNRMGFNNAGSDALAKRLRGLRDGGWEPVVPVGVNIGKSKITPLDEAVDDYRTSARRLRDVADYLVINVSSPNTPGLRELQDKEHLARILDGVRSEAGDVPVFVKLAPDLDLSALDEAVAVAESGGAAGIVATNTTIRRYDLPDVGPGGLSGRPLLPRALEVVRHVAHSTELPVIGVGGIRTIDDVEAMLGAGARAVQVYTAFIYEGPMLASRLNRSLADALAVENARDVGELRERLRERAARAEDAA
ncbi:MAG: quinone-dependent dihydroorotate dehydrogenase [Myxococcota bacterium]